MNEILYTFGAVLLFLVVGIGVFYLIGLFIIHTDPPTTTPQEDHHTAMSIAENEQRLQLLEIARRSEPGSPEHREIHKMYDELKARHDKKWKQRVDRLT